MSFFKGKVRFPLRKMFVLLLLFFKRRMSFLVLVNEVFFYFLVLGEEKMPFINFRKWHFLKYLFLFTFRDFFFFFFNFREKWLFGEKNPSYFEVKKRKKFFSEEKCIGKKNKKTKSQRYKI